MSVDRRAVDRSLPDTGMEKEYQVGIKSRAEVHARRSIDKALRRGERIAMAIELNKFVEDAYRRGVLAIGEPYIPGVPGQIRRLLKLGGVGIDVIDQMYSGLSPEHRRVIREVFEKALEMYKRLRAGGEAGSSSIELYLRGVAEDIYKRRIELEEKVARGEEVELGMTKEWRSRAAPYVDLANKIKKIPELAKLPTKSAVIAYSLAAFEALGRNNTRQAEVYMSVVKTYLVRAGLSTGDADRVVNQIRQYLGLRPETTANTTGGKAARE